MANDSLLFRCICGDTKRVFKYYPDCADSAVIYESHWMAAFAWMNEHMQHWPINFTTSLDLGHTPGIIFGTENLLAVDFVWPTEKPIRIADGA